MHAEREEAWRALWLLGGPFDGAAYLTRGEAVARRELAVTTPHIGASGVALGCITAVITYELVSASDTELVYRAKMST